MKSDKVQNSIGRYFLDKILYTKTIKNCLNYLLTIRFVINNPLYLRLLELKIKKTIAQYKKIPYSLRIENTNVCNANCYMCPHSVMKRKQGFMTRDLYKKIINEATRNKIEYINLHNFGEPLLDKDFVWKIKYAKEHGQFRISTNTNAFALDKNLAEDIIEAGLDELYISLDANSDKTYSKIRRGLNFNKVVGNIRYFIKFRNKCDRKYPKVILDFLETDINKHEINNFIKNWQGKVDNICISQIHDWSLKKEGISRFLSYRNYVTYSQTPCRLPFTELLINWDGSASPCCQDIDGEVIIGDANRQSLEEIWQGDKIKAIRQKHLLLRTEKLLLCKNCKLRTFWWVF